MNQSLIDERDLLSKPGDTILETLEAIKMTQSELAERMGKTPSKINDIISGKEPITINTALQLEKVLNIDAQFWINRENIYREKLIRLEQEEALEECKEWLEKQPLKELKKYGYISENKKGAKLADEVLQFYGVVSPIQWESLYINEYANSSFRKSTSHKTALASMAAWLRIGEIEMRKLNLQEYNKDSFKNTFEEIKLLVKDFPEDYALQLQEVCAQKGVAVVYTVNLPQAPISGATRWLGGSPLIQLTDRFKTNDHFWFTFFHEVGHILLHGKKEVFIEDFEGVELDTSKEHEANKFAAKMLLPDSFVDELPEKITDQEVKAIARKYKTHPAIVIGRLQNLKKVPYTFGNNFKIRISLDYVIEEQSKK